MSARLPGYENTVQCPYCRDLILAQRIQIHLIKCKPQHPDIVRAVCPFNQTHHVRQEELNAHVTNCPSRGIFDLHVYDVNRRDNAAQAQARAPPPTRINPPTQKKPNNHEECWDHYNTGTYNPNTYAEQARVLRAPGLSTRSERRQFRANERQRQSRLDQASQYHP